MPLPRQIELFTPRSSRQLQEHARRLEHGGDVRKGRRKLARPFDRRRPLHLTLRSPLARGEWSMLRASNAERIRRLAYGLARENGVRIYQYANSGNHLHLLLRAKTRAGFQRFLRTFSALVPRIVTGAKKGAPIAARRKGEVAAGSARSDKSPPERNDGIRKFWDALAWSRIVDWGRQFFNGRYYVIRNELESEGLVACRPRTGSRTARGRASLRP